jgi:hypothetical protein
MGLTFWKEGIMSLILALLALDFMHSFIEFNREANDVSKQALDLHEGILKYSQMEEGKEGPSLFLSLY